MFKPQKSYLMVSTWSRSLFFNELLTKGLSKYETLQVKKLLIVAAHD
jgi:hypothetical protein